jgi:hypothetical protein
VQIERARRISARVQKLAFFAFLTQAREPLAFAADSSSTASSPQIVLSPSHTKEQEQYEIDASCREADVVEAVGLDTLTLIG